ncbi:MAG TPA: hypothetical protein ENJ82_07785, partial [Bacteroidetes bacterium]|nr:hypothetical protein [Bacteroidota bacterium]
IDRILAIYLDSKDMVWLSSAGQGVYRYQIADLLAGKPTVEHYLDEEEVNGIVEDLEGNMWFSTLRGGLCMKPAASFLIQYADQTSGLAGQSVEDIAIQQDGRIFLAHQNNRITQMKGGLVEKEIVVSKTCRTCGIRSLSALPNGNLLVCANKHIYMLNESGKVKSWVKESPKFIRLQDGDLWIGNYSSLQRVSLSAIEHTEMQKIGGELVAEIRSYISWFDRDKQRVYVGSNDGLWLVDLESGEIHRHANKLLWGKIFAIEGDEKGRIWVATDGAGVVVLDRDKCYQMGKKEGLNSNICRRICLDKNGGVWMGTQSGVNYLAPEMDLSQPVIRSVGENEGLPSNEIRALAAYENEMLIGTTDGLARMPLDYFERVKAPRLQAEITALKIAGRDTAIFSVYELGHAQSEIEIQFTALHLQARGKVDFRYRMVGLGDGNWTETGERMVQYRSVPPGNYYFEVQAKVNGASWGLPTGFSLRIAPPFTQTAWFWSLCVLGSLLLATALAAGRGRQVRRREQQKNVLQKQINDLKLKALRAQMNPHFIFNSLAAIQHFITSHNDQAAHKYLSTFSRLIRLVLENSRLELISLKEEEKVLRLYLELEHLRFRDRFSYEIMMDKSLNPNQIQVPPMLIQPFIENAVRHGLRHKSEPGKLWVHFSQHGSQFCCEVKDNGIGREASARIQQGRFRPAPSRGMEITGQRIDSLLNLSQGAAKIEIEDLIGPEGQAQGTLVRILLPVIPK